VSEKDSDTVTKASRNAVFLHMRLRKEKSARTRENVVFECSARYKLHCIRGKTDADSEWDFVYELLQAQQFEKSLRNSHQFFCFNAHIFTFVTNKYYYPHHLW